MIFSYLLNMQSHPSWVCGLKHSLHKRVIYPCKSHPSWVCGLKPHLVGAVWYLVGHTLRGCVD